MNPVLPQLPRPRPFSQRVLRPRPSLSIRTKRDCSLEGTVKPMDWLSGDQNGCVAPSVPGSNIKSVEFIDLIARRVLLPDDPIPMATCLPAGEMVAPPGPSKNGPIRSSSAIPKVRTSVRGTEQLYHHAA